MRCRIVDSNYNKTDRESERIDYSGETFFVLCLLLVEQLWAAPCSSVCMGACVNAFVCTCIGVSTRVVRIWLSRDKGERTDALFWRKVAYCACLLQVPDDGSLTVLWQLHGFVEMAQIGLVRCAVFKCHIWYIFLPDF